jgi:hypothetical protein
MIMQHFTAVLSDKDNDFVLYYRKLSNLRSVLKKISLWIISYTAVLCMVSTSVAFGQRKMSPELLKSLAAVDADQIKADISYLADDQLEGRGPGSRGYQMAVDYVVNRLKSLGVEPAGENGGWTQKVHFRKAFVKNVKFSIKQAHQLVQDSLTEGTYVVYPNPLLKTIHVQSPLAFAGYGVSQPALGYDDYKNINVKGKIVVILRGTPESFSSSVSAHAMNNTTIFKAATAHGAIGVIMVNADPTIETLSDLSKGVYSVIDGQGKVAVSRSDYKGKLQLFAAVNYRLLEDWVHKAGNDLPQIIKKLEAGMPDSFALPLSVSVSADSQYEDLDSYNVIGKITGSDPKLKNEYVVHSAHLDHLGIGKAILGDSIYNGAHDNASGIASLLGIASIYKELKVKPRRSILITILTGEELGLLGSGYFTEHPTVPLHSSVANVNTDMPTIIAPLLSITALGSEHSSLINQVKAAAAYLNLTVEDDPEPKQARFTRSDQYSFVAAGIPALHIKYGSKTIDGKNDLNDRVSIWRAKYYHKPQDDINGTFDFQAGAKYSRLNFLIGYLVAQDRLKPKWNKGDVFGQR